MAGFSLSSKIRKLPKRILFTPSPGYGHILPCLAAADALKSFGFDCAFLLGSADESDLKVITNKKYQLFQAPVEPPKQIKNISLAPTFRAHFFSNYFYKSIKTAKRVIETFKPSFVWTDMCYNVKPAIQLVSEEIIFLSTHRLSFSQNYTFPKDFVERVDDYNKVLRKFKLPPLKRIVDLVFGDLMIYPFPSQILLGPGIRPTNELYLNTGHLIPPENITIVPNKKKTGIFITAGTFFRGEQLERILQQLISTLSKIEPIYLAVDAQTASALTLTHQTRLVRFVDYGKVLANCDLIIHHAGHGTTETALYYALPQMVYPTGTKGRYNVAFQLEKLGVGKLLNTKAVNSQTEILKTVEYLHSAPIKKKCLELAELTKSLGGPNYAAKIINAISEGTNVLPEITSHQRKVITIRSLN